MADCASPDAPNWCPIQSEATSSEGTAPWKERSPQRSRSNEKESSVLSSAASWGNGLCANRSFALEDPEDPLAALLAEASDTFQKSQPDGYPAEQTAASSSVGRILEGQGCSAAVAAPIAASQWTLEQPQVVLASYHLGSTQDICSACAEDLSRLLLQAPTPPETTAKILPHGPTSSNVRWPEQSPYQDHYKIGADNNVHIISAPAQQLSLADLQAMGAKLVPIEFGKWKLVPGNTARSGVASPPAPQVGWTG